MSNHPRPPAPLHRPPSILQDCIRAYIALPADHPARIGIRTYRLGLLLSLGPTFIPLIAKIAMSMKGGKDDRVTTREVIAGLWRALRRELGPFGFAFAITIAVAGGSFLQNALESLISPPDDSLQNDNVKLAVTSGTSNSLRSAKSRLRSYWTPLSDVQQTFLTNALASTVAIILIQWEATSGRPPGVPEFPLILPIPTEDIPKRQGVSPTLNLTLILFVRALDSVVHGGLQGKLLQKLKGKEREVTHRSTEPEEATSRYPIHAENWINKWTSSLDSLVFCICSARVIWCFFYKPKTLPTAYVKWISRLAEIDPRLILALQSIRNGSLSFVRRYSASPDLMELTKDLGYPASWGDVSIIPACGTDATPIWRNLGVEGRDGIGGVPCELVHGGNGAGNSCMKNIGIRGQRAWLAAFLIYLPVHILPAIIRRPRDLTSSEKLIPILLGVMRSATFLSAFVQLMWLGVCSTRTFFFARLLPWISHDYFDGPYGCTLVASLICGSSIWIENPRRRAEVALYLLPRAIRTVLSDYWLKSGRKRIQFVERVVFVLSLSTLLTSGIHRPESLRGLSRWAANYVLRGPGSVVKKITVIPP